MLNVWAIMATAGRHTLAERSIGLFMEQDYQGPHNLLVYNNSPEEVKFIEQDQDRRPLHSRAKLVNQSIDSFTGERYTNLGAIYRDALLHIPENCDVIVHWDDDDLFLPNHLSEGLKGLQRGQEKFLSEEKICLAYKPAKSYYRHPGGVELMSNTLEPSIFVYADHIRKHGYSLTTTDQHLQWVNPLVYGSRIYVDETGISTLIYNWGDNIPTFKTSGNAGSPQNFDNYHKFSKDHGDRILTPWPREKLEEYYKLVQ